MSGFNPLDYSSCFSQPLRVDLSTPAWITHIPFGMFLIEVLQPKVLVELGTHSGNSYCAFCQTIKRLNIDTKAYAIDTWKGDVHSGFYGTEILEELKAHHDPLYGDFSQLLQKTFDEAVDYFSDGSIDLLHIDGLHSYEAAKHDFNLWLPKLSTRGVILLHDINVRESDFGVWQLWDELKLNFSSFEIIHGQGLGILAVGSNFPKSLNVFLKESKNTPKIREFFYMLGSRLLIDIAFKELTEKLVIKEKTEETLLAQSQYSGKLSQALSAQLASMKNDIQSLNELLTRQEEMITKGDEAIVKKDMKILALTVQLTEAEKNKELLVQTLTEKSQEASILNTKLSEISKSKVWRIALLLRKIKTLFMPPRETQSRFEKKLADIFLFLATFLEKAQLKKDLRLIRSSKLFNEEWYLANNEDVKKSGMDPAEHYLRHGGIEGRNPGPYFAGGWYLDNNKDVLAARLNPLVHYLRYGMKEGRARSQHDHTNDEVQRSSQ